MTSQKSHMKDLYAKLHQVGYNKKYVNSLLPDWWDNEIVETKAGLQEASLILGQTFGIAPKTLWEAGTTPTFKLPKGICFKHRNNVNEEDLSIACAVAHSLAKVVLKAFPNKSKSFSNFQPDASDLRKRLLAENGKKWISFQDVLDYCFKIGIPVIYLHHLPNKAKKMEGLVFQQDGKPVIVLTQKHPHGYMMFDLAHELGHITLGHVSNDGVFIDRKIDSKADDEIESAANRFALELLTGDPECGIVPVRRNLNANELASAAILYGEKNQIDPLHIVLNYAYSQNHWGAAQAAIKEISKNNPTDQEIIKTALLKSLNFDELKDDDCTFLQTHLKGKVD